MRRTGSEEIGTSKALGRRSIPWAPRVLLLAHFFGEAPERRPWMLKHDDAGRCLPGFIFAFAFVFYRVDLPTDCAIEPVLVLGLGVSPGIERAARGRRF
jgi:hypothetical protein